MGVATVWFDLHLLHIYFIQSDELDTVKFDVPGCGEVLKAACDEGPFVLEVVKVG